MSTMDLPVNYDSREELLEATREIFLKQEYILSPGSRAASLDFVAVKKSPDSVVLTKVSLDIDSFKSPHGTELKFVSQQLSGSPMIVGQKTNKQPMLSGVVYSRHDIPAINLETLLLILRSTSLPQFFACRGAILGKINPENLRRAREREGMAVNELAGRTGVSPRSIRNYEAGKGAPSQASVERLKTVLKDESFMDQINPLKYEAIKAERIETSSLGPRNALQREVDDHLRELGLSPAWFRSMPFTTLLDEEKDKEKTSSSTSATEPLLAGITPDVGTQSNVRRMNVTASIGKATGTETMWVIEEEEPACGEQAPLLIISVSDLEDLVRKISHNESLNVKDILSLLRKRQEHSGGH